MNLLKKYFIITFEKPKLKCVQSIISPIDMTPTMWENEKPVFSKDKLVLRLAKRED